MTNRFWDNFFSGVSWIIVASLMVGVVTLFFIVPGSSGPVAQWLGPEGARWFYICLYGLEAVWLTAAKMFKKKTYRKNALLVIYLTGIFTTILSYLGPGLTVKIIDNVVFTIVSAACWLYWKFKTEYINPAAFQAVAATLHEDAPPSMRA